MKHDKNRPMDPKPTHQPNEPQQPDQPFPSNQPNRREDREHGERRRQNMPTGEHPSERSDRDSGAGRPVQLDQTEKEPVK